MFPARAGLTFAATVEQVKCPVKLSMNNGVGGVVEIQCELVHGHRQKRHQYVGQTDDGPVQIFWPKTKKVN